MHTQTVLLIRREGVSTCAPRLLIIDDLVPGLLTGQLYAISVPEGKVFPLSSLIELYDFPQERGKCGVNILGFLTGFNQQLFNQVTYYEDLTFDLKHETQSNR